MINESKEQSFARYQSKVYRAPTRITAPLDSLPLWRDAFIYLLCFGFLGAGILGYIVTTFTVVVR